MADATRRRGRPKLRTRRRRRQNAPPPTFRVGELERIYVVLIGTNNLGGGMDPAQTVRGIDAVGRAILRLHGEAVLPLSILPNASDMKSTSMMSAWESFNSDSAMFTSRSTEVSVMGVSRIGFRCGDLPLL